LHSLRGVLDQLDTHSVEVSALTVRTPDLDDVFLSLTGHPGTGHPGTGHPGTEPLAALTVKDGSR
jgi:ABC-2 type transport system ATP-binding protein